jgi:hypothetical protein
MKLQSFAENNKETQGKFTIGDEKVSMGTLQIHNRKLTYAAIQRFHATWCEYFSHSAVH